MCIRIHRLLQVVIIPLRMIPPTIRCFVIRAVLFIYRITRLMDMAFAQSADTSRFDLLFLLKEGACRWQAPSFRLDTILSFYRLSETY